MDEQKRKESAQWDWSLVIMIITLMIVALVAASKVTTFK